MVGTDPQALSATQHSPTQLGPGPRGPPPLQLTPGRTERPQLTGRQPACDADPARGKVADGGPSGPLGAPAAATHRCGGLPGGGHDGGKRSRHVIAAHTPAAQTAHVGNGKNWRPAAAQRLASGESQPAPPGARSGACAPTPRPAVLRQRRAPAT